MQVGRWQARSLEFGRFRLDGGAMFGVVPRVVWEQEAPPDGRNRIALALRCLLLQDGERVVLVDCGVGDKDGPSFREIFAVEDEGAGVARSLAECGLAPGDVTDLVLTHLHFDHAGGAVARDAAGRGVPAFPNATIHVQRRQWEWAQAPSLRDRASYLRENLEPLRQARLNLLEGEGEILPGLRARVVEGHTQGMQVVEVEGKPGLVYCADLVPTAAHLPPAWVMGYDLHPLTVVEEKLALYSRIGDGSAWLVFEHDPRWAAARIDAAGKRPAIVEARETL
jgi:glyoxylase-like metal-dependent hydrolase (beta-lactamase superfamily II)